MPNVLVFGASTYIGLPLCLALRSTNHAVFGIVPTAAKAALLESHRITAILCDETTTSRESIWSKVLDQHDIDIVIDCSPLHELHFGILSVVVAEARRRRDTMGDPRRMGFVCMSATWVHGFHVNAPTEQGEFVSTPPEFEKATEAFIRGAQARFWQQGQVLSHAESTSHDDLSRAELLLNVIVLNTGIVYGHGSDLLSPFFDPIRRAGLERVEVARVPVDPETLQDFVHVDDVTDAIERAVAKLDTLQVDVSPIVDLVAEKIRLTDLVLGARKALGFEEGKVEFIGSGVDSLCKALSLSKDGDPDFVFPELSWDPRKLDLMASVDQVARDWSAAHPDPIDPELLDPKWIKTGISDEDIKAWWEKFSQGKGEPSGFLQ